MGNDLYTNPQDEVQLPNVSKELVDSLDKIFPKMDFDTSYSLREMDFISGQRSVIRYLRTQYEIQNENILSQ